MTGTPHLYHSVLEKLLLPAPGAVGRPVCPSHPEPHPLGVPRGGSGRRTETQPLTSGGPWCTPPAPPHQSPCSTPWVLGAGTVTLLLRGSSLQGRGGHFCSGDSGADHGGCECLTAKALGSLSQRPGQGGTITPSPSFVMVDTTRSVLPRDKARPEVGREGEGRDSHSRRPGACPQPQLCAQSWVQVPAQNREVMGGHCPHRWRRRPGQQS